MILGVCGSFAVIPAVSMVTSASATTRRAPAAHQTGDSVEPSAKLGSQTVAAWALSDVGMSAVAPGSADARSLAWVAGAAAVGMPFMAPTASSLSASPATVAPTSVAPATLPPTAVPPTTVPPPAGPPTFTIIETPRAPVLAATPISMPKVVLSDGLSGVASWLNTIPAGTCANNSAPMGATITVTNGGGATVTCRVVSRGPFVSGRIVDLAEPTFAQLGSVSRGLVAVTVTW